MNGTGNFTGAGSGAPKTIDYDSVKNFLISSVDMAPAVVMNLTILRSDPPTWIMGTKPSANSTSGVNFSGAVLDVTRRKGYFAGQQGPDGPSYGSINVSQ